MNSKCQIFHSQQIFYKRMKPVVDEIHTDVVGNVIAHKRGSGKKLMLIAHHDVVKLMVTYIDNNGFLYFKPSGVIDASILPARKIIIRHSGQSVIGIIGKKPIHLQREDGTAKITFEDLWIDIGAVNKEEALAMVDIGDYAFYSSANEEMPHGLITCGGLDDYAGLCVLMNVAESIKDSPVPWDIYFVASNFEEIGMRGAQVAANAIKPDYCIAIDVAHATDYPTMNPIRDGDIYLNKGCVLSYGPNVDNSLLTQLRDLTKQNEIKYQIEASPYPTGTDANVVQVSASGIMTAIVSIPCRYMHTPYEIVSVHDINSATDLISCFLLVELNG